MKKLQTIGGLIGVLFSNTFASFPSRHVDTASADEPRTCRIVIERFAWPCFKINARANSQNSKGYQLSILSNLTSLTDLFYNFDSIFIKTPVFS